MFPALQIRTKTFIADQHAKKNIRSIVQSVRNYEYLQALDEIILFKCTHHFQHCTEKYRIWVLNMRRMINRVICYQSKPTSADYEFHLTKLFGYLDIIQGTKIF